MPQTIEKKEKVSLNRKHFEILEKKASFLEELLVFIEDKQLGYLMEKTEKEKNISLPQARKSLK